MRRRRQQFEFHAAHRHIDDTGSYLKAGRFRVRRGGDRISARWITNSRYHSPPYFHGHLRDDASGGVTVTGTIHESRGESVWTTVYGSAGVLMGAAAIACLVSQVWIGLAICAPGAIVFGFMWRTFRASRRQRFSADAGHLQTALRHYIATGDRDRTRGEAPPESPGVVLPGRSHPLDQHGFRVVGTTTSLW